MKFSTNYYAVFYTRKKNYMNIFAASNGRLYEILEVYLDQHLNFANHIQCVACWPCLSSSDVFLFCWAAFLSISLLPLFFLSLFLFFLFLRPCLIHARMPDWGRAFVHGHTFLHSWSGPMVVGLLHGATFLSNPILVLFVSFIGP